MQKIIITLSLLALTACGGGSTPEAPDTKTPEVVLPDSVISGDITLTDNGTSILTGNVSLTEGATFITQSNTETLLGKFSISADGAWQYEPNRGATSFIELADKETITETITVVTSDGLSNTISVTLVGVNDLPEFSSGSGINSQYFYSNNLESISGRVIVLDPDKNESFFKEQERTYGNLGFFSITQSGHWVYTHSDESLDFISTQEEFTITSFDGSEHQITITIIPTAEIDAKSLEPVSDTLLIPFSEATSFVEQSNYQGAFGVFSINAIGEWSYSMTNLASALVSPVEMFTVKAVNGTEYRVAVLVKGLFQRLVTAHDYSLNVLNEEHTGLGTSYSVVHIPIDSFYDPSYILNAKEVATKETTYHYDELGNITREITLDKTVSDSEPVKHIGSNYKYDNDLLSVALKEISYYSFNEGQPVLDRFIEVKHTIENNKLTDSESKGYLYDETGENIETSYHSKNKSVYNNLNKRSEYSTSYLDTEDHKIDEDKKGDRLRNRYFYQNNGNLDYRQSYRVSSTRLYSGLWFHYSYFYDNSNRIAYTQSNFADYTLEDGIYVYGEIDTNSPSTYIYNYMDELDILVVYRPDASIFNWDTGESELQADQATIYQYEDIDHCGQFHWLESVNSPDVVPKCRVKTADASSSIDDLPDTIVTYEL